MALRTRNVAPPAASKVKENIPPIKPGTVIPWDKLTDSEKEHFAKLGLENVEIPSNVQDFIARYAKEATAVTSDMLKELPTTPPVLEGEANIEDLPEKRQNEIKAAIKQATQFWSNRENQLRYDSSLSPSVQDALTAVESPAVIVDDRAVKQTTVDESLAEAVSLASGNQVSDNSLQVEPGKVSDSGAVGLTNCPHCNFDLSLPSPANPTDEQKLAFLAATLSNVPFEHEYTFLGDRASVVFRTPTAKVCDLVSTQLVHDTVAGILISRESIFVRQQIYMMCVSLVSITLPDRKYVLPDLADISDAPMPDGRKNSGGVAELHRYIVEELLVSEPLRAAIGHKYAVFAQTVGKLAARIDDSDFWNVTGPPG